MDVRDVVSSGTSWKEKGKQRANAADVFLESEASSSPRPTSNRRGEDHGSDAGPELAGADTSGEIRIRGKEREWTAVREERRARQQWWESEVEMTVIREEKADYEDNIKQVPSRGMRFSSTSVSSLPIADHFHFHFQSWQSDLRP